MTIDILIVFISLLFVLEENMFCQLETYPFPETTSIYYLLCLENLGALVHKLVNHC